MKISTMICAVALSVCGTLSAQTTTDTLRVRFSTPVTVGETVVPAGDCRVQIVRGSTSSSTLILRSESGVSAQALVNRLNKASADEPHSHVVLRHNGSDYLLEQVWLEDGTGFQIMGLAQ
jgi:hypothetical protein